MSNDQQCEPQNEHSPMDSMVKRRRIMYLSLCVFFLMLAYSFTRAAVDSLFLEVHGSRSLPYAWLYVGIAMLITVILYNPMLTKWNLFRLYGIVSLISALLLGLFVIAINYKVPYIHYALYVFKDIYMVVLVEIYYSYCNSVFPIRTARWTYGLLGVVAALTAMLGGALVSNLAGMIGTETMIWCGVPLLTCNWWAAVLFSRKDKSLIPLCIKEKTGSIVNACRIVLNSRYLLFVLLFMILFRLIMSLLDYEFNTALEIAYPITDERTSMIGRLYSILNMCTPILHSSVGIILRIVCVPITIMSIPIILGSGIIAYSIFPIFIVIAGVVIAARAFDYTVFRVAKEMLYIPLNYEEKTAGKSVVDMFNYRFAKAIASVGLIVLGAYHIMHIAIWIALALVVIWIALAVVVAKRFRKQSSRKDELKSYYVGK